MYPEMRYCKKCQKEHPNSEKFWFKNGGKLRKCKIFYSKYEADRKAAAKAARPA